MSNSSSTRSILPSASQVSSDALQRWSAVFQAQLRLAGRLSLLYRHAARESQAARSPVELLSIQLNLQKALVTDCSTFTADCMRALAGFPATGGYRVADRGQTEAIAPVMGAIAEPIMEGMQAAMFAAAGAAPGVPYMREGAAEQRPQAVSVRHVDAEAHATARGPATKSSARRAAPVRAPRREEAAGAPRARAEAGSRARTQMRFARGA